MQRNNSQIPQLLARKRNIHVQWNRCDHMGLGSTAKKLQLVAERAEQMYKQVGELRDQITELRTTVEATGTRVEQLEYRTEQQWVLLTAIAEEHDIDVEAVLTDAAIEEVPDETDTPDEGSTEEPTAADEESTEGPTSSETMPDEPADAT